MGGFFFNHYFVVCTNCYAQTTEYNPRFKSKQECINLAIRDWNTRYDRAEKDKGRTKDTVAT